MKKAVVIYKSDTGFTKKYAEWIARELQCELMENKKINPSKLVDYDTIILGGSVMANMIAGAELIKNHFGELDKKQLVVYACGMGAPNAEEQEAMWAQNFTQEQLTKVKCFYCRGGLDFNKLKGIKKMMLKMMCKKMAQKTDRTQQETDMLNALNGPVDFSDVSYIQPILEYIK